MHLLSFLSLVLSLAAISYAQLPPYDGEYGVGIVTIEVPVRQPRNLSDEVLTTTGQPAFQLETVLFTIWYPADKDNKSTKASPSWLPQPLDLVAEGIAEGTNGSVGADLVQVGLQGLAGNAVIPAFTDVPFSSGTNFPVLVFSHGDTTFPIWYSRYLGQVAAFGAIVVGITHRDGSNAGTVVQINGRPNRNVTYIEPDQLSPAVNATGLAILERSFRKAEVEDTISVLQAINNGQGQEVYQNSSRGEGETLAGWRDKFDFTKLMVGGHSFGATSALDILQNPETPEYSVRAGILLDPGKESGPLPENINIPMLIADSESWSSEPTPFYGSDHFEVVRSIAEHSVVATGATWFMTLLGSVHSSITDAGLVAGTSLLSFFDPSAADATIQPAQAIDQYVGVTREYIRYFSNITRDGVLASNVTNPIFVPKPNSSVEGDDLSYWEIHVAPQNNGTITPTSAAAVVQPLGFVTFAVFAIAAVFLI